MHSNLSFVMTPRAFTRREKTCIRQDVKRFQKISRDHGCATFEDYAEFVYERTRRDDEGHLTQKSFELFRGLGAFFGDQLLDETTMSRGTANVEKDESPEALAHLIVANYPGWLLLDHLTGQSVVIPFIMSQRIFTSNYWTASLDDIFDEIVDWNHGYLTVDEVQTPWIAGPDLEAVNLWAA